MGDAPTVSVVVPALNEQSYLPDTLESIREQDAEVSTEIIVVDGGSTDRTPEIAERFDATVVYQSAGSIGAGRHRGAQVASGDWLAFIDADTVVAESYLREMRSFLIERDLAAASARCNVTEDVRGKAMQVVVNRVFPRLSRPLHPGFNVVVDSDAYHDVGGFPDVPNEDTAFSRRLGRRYETAYHPDVLVETSGRRFAASGLSGALVHYLALDWRRLSAEGESNPR